MSFITTRFLSNSGSLFSILVPNSNRILIESAATTVQTRNYAARKGTRERKQKKKVKVEVQKVGFIPHSERKKHKLLANLPKKKFDDSWKSNPIDNVYITKYFRMQTYPFVEAVQNHVETHHPDMYNKPTATLHVSIELNMQGEKATRFVDNFTRIAQIPHKFEHGEERSILAFDKTPDGQKGALDAGAQLSGGVDLIKQIQNGQLDLQDFQFIIAHPNILPELVQLRGLMKKKFPNPKHGTLDVDVAQCVTRFLHGVNYTATKDEHEKDFGTVQTAIGTINMDPKHLEENFKALLNDINTMKPKRPGHFISRCLLWSPPSPEKFLVDHNLYLISTAEKTSKDEVDEEEEKGERVAL